MNENGMSAADVMALANDNNGWNNPFIYLILFAFLGNGGFGFGNNASAGMINNDFLYTNLNQALGQGFTQSIQQGFNIQSAIAALQTNFCNVGANIDSVKYENAQNTCKITTAIHEEGEATRALITQNTMQNLRDELAKSQLALSQAEQNAYLVSQLKA